MRAYSVRGDVPDIDAEALGQYSPFVQHLLFHRGIVTSDEAEKFLAPDYDQHTHDPFLMKDMNRAVERLYQAVKKSEKIIVYSDYDADGGPGGVIFHDFFKKIGYENFLNYIPNRHTEGFGLNKEAIEEFEKNGAALLITVDCGIADVREVEMAQKEGIDVIITDHHEVGAEVPPAYAILNPKQRSCAYPEKMLCGSGVAFKFVQAFLKKHAGEFNVKEGWEKWLLDLVGIATLSDMVPLTGENRVFAYYGLTVLRKSPRPGLQKLLGKLKITQRDLVEDDVGFSIAPRINAASRMGESMDAFRFLSTASETEADVLADHLNRMNDERKGTVASMVKEIKRIVVERHGTGERKLIVLGNPKWKPSLVGLAANALMREYLCPVFVWGREEGMAIKGSCRSGGAVDLVALMQATTPGVFVDFGGHKLSGGFTLAEERVHFLEEELLKAYGKVGEKDRESLGEAFVDKKLRLEDVSWDTYREVEKFAPFGIGNSKPTFLFEAVPVKAVKNFGKEKNHLEIVLSKNDFGETISAIGFFMGGEEPKYSIEQNQKINLVATIEKSVFRSGSRRTPELRLRIVDVF